MKEMKKQFKEYLFKPLIISIILTLASATSFGVLGWIHLINFVIYLIGTMLGLLFSNILIQKEE
jgi:ABC-type multidrug transport system permease subunit